MSTTDDEAYVEDVRDEYFVTEEHKGEENTFSSLVFKAVTNPWLIFLVLGLGYYAINTFVKIHFQKWLSRRQQNKEAAEMKKNPDHFRQRMEAMERHRSELQRKHDEAAARHLEIEKLKEDQKRAQKIKEWEDFEQGKGYKAKSTFKKEYNPLMGSNGGGGGVCYRPTRRGAGGGGGG